MSDEYKIKEDDVVTITKMNHIVEVQYMEKCNRYQTIKKLDKDNYVSLSTGEIKEYSHIENRSQSKNSLYQTFKKLRYLINNNFKGSKNELFVTLTYKENMTYVNRLYDDFRKFIKRLRYKYRDKSTIDYISVVEPQQRGAWHCHVLLRFNDVEKIYIPNEEIRSLWGHGFVRVNRLEGVDNIGAYVSAYLTDLEMEGDFEGDKVKRLNGKKYIKGARLHLYPPGINIYRCSRGIKPPDRRCMKYKDIKKIVKDAPPHYFKVYNVQKDDFENVIVYEQYNLKRQL